MVCWPNRSLQPTAIPLRGLSAAELKRYVDARVLTESRASPAKVDSTPI